MPPHVRLSGPPDAVTAGETGLDRADRLEYAREVVRAEAAALDQVARRLDDSFSAGVDLILRSQARHGRVVLTGTGKSADVAQKIAGTLNSTGTRSYTLDPTKAVHGDLGMVHPDDVGLVLSHSGESEEIVRLLGPLRRLSLGLIGVTGSPNGTLARRADVAIMYGPLEEVCPLGLAPSASTTAMIAIGDALAFVLSRIRDFSREDFARFHPAGSLGKRLMDVDAVMRRGDELRIAPDAVPVREVLARSGPAARTVKGRRTGAVMLTGPDGRLTGIFTDSDLARLIEQRRDGDLDRPVRAVMTPNPIQISAAARVSEAVELLRAYKISELPVVDADGRPVGLVDITDVLGLMPAEARDSPDVHDTKVA